MRSELIRRRFVFSVGKQLERGAARWRQRPARSLPHTTGIPVRASAVIGAIVLRLGPGRLVGDGRPRRGRTTLVLPSVHDGNGPNCAR